MSPEARQAYRVIRDGDKRLSKDEIATITEAATAGRDPDIINTAAAAGAATAENTLATTTIAHQKAQTRAHEVQQKAVEQEMQQLAAKQEVEGARLQLQATKAEVAARSLQLPASLEVIKSGFEAFRGQLVHDASFPGYAIVGRDQMSTDNLAPVFQTALDDLLGLAKGPVAEFAKHGYTYIELFSSGIECCEPLCVFLTVGNPTCKNLDETKEQCCHLLQFSLAVIDKLFDSKPYQVIRAPHSNAIGVFTYGGFLGRRQLQCVLTKKSGKYACYTDKYDKEFKTLEEELLKVSSDRDRIWNLNPLDICRACALVIGGHWSLYCCDNGGFLRSLMSNNQVDRSSDLFSICLKIHLESSGGAAAAGRALLGLSARPG